MSNWFSPTINMPKPADYATQLQTNSTQNDIPVVYGEALVGSNRIFSEVTGTGDENDMLTAVFVLAEGEIYSFKQLYIDDLPVFKEDNNPRYGSGTVGQADITDEFNKHVQVQISTGSEDDPFFFDMVKANSDGRWTDSDRLYGRAAIALKIKLDPYKGKVKSDGFKVTALVEGKQISDIRYETPVFGYTEVDAIPFGRNPALCLYDYLTNLRYGCSIQEDDIDLYSFVLAANWCDTQKLYCDGVVDQSQSYKKNIEALQASFGGALADVDGVLYLTVDAPQASTFDFTPDNMTGKVKIKHNAVEKYFNQLEVTWFSPAKEYSEDTIVYPPEANAEQIISDGRIISQRVSYPFTKTQPALDFLASKEVLKARFSDEIEFTSNIEGFLVGVHDVVTVTCPEVQIENKKYRIISTKRDIKKAQVTFKAVEYDELVYTGTWESTVTPSGSNKSHIDPVDNLTFSFVEASDTFVGLLQWEQEQAKVRKYRIFYKRSTSPESSFTFYKDVVDKHAYISGLNAGMYDFEVIAVDIFNRTSEPTYLYNVDLSDDTVYPTVTGITALNDEQDFVISWDDMSNVQIGSIDTEIADGNKSVSAYMKHYEVLFKRGGNTVYTGLSSTNSFRYSFDLNKANGLYRDFDVEVRIVGKAGGKSNTPATISVLNPQASQPTGIDFQVAPATFTVDFIPPQESDYVGTEIHMSTVMDFAPTGTTLVKDLKSGNTLTKLIDEDETYYVRLGSYDMFGKDNINYTQAYTVRTKSAQSILVEISSESLSQDVIDSINDKAEKSDLLSLEAQVAANKTAMTSYVNEETAKVLVVADQAVQDAANASQKATDEAASALQTARDELASEKALLQAEIASKETDLTPVYAAIATEQQSRIDGDSAVNSRVDVLVSRTDTNEASISTLEQTVTNNESSTSTRLTEIQASLDTKVDSLSLSDRLDDAETYTDERFDAANALISTEEQARIDSDTALSTRIDSVVSQANTNKANITSEQTARTDADTALGLRIDSVSAKTDTNAANIISEQTARVTADNALGQRIDSVEATTDDNTAEITSLKQTVTTGDSALSNRLDTLTATVATNKDDATTYTDSKYSDAVTLINTKDSAQTSALTSLEAKVTDIQKDGNLLAGYLKEWKVGNSPSDTGLSLNGAASENSLVSGMGPYGAASALWKCQSSNTTSDADGGWNGAWFDVDSSKAYRYAVWAHQTSTNGTVYHGLQGNTIENFSGTVISNPYFWNGDLPSTGKWYLIVGVIYPNASTSSSNISGVYDPATGQKVLSGSDYRWVSSTTRSYGRSYWYYSTSTSAVSYFYAPRVDVLDGTEPSISSILDSAKGVYAKAEEAYNVAVTADGKIDNSYTLRLNSAGKVAGFGLSNNGTSSIFAVQADTFAVYDGSKDHAVFAVENGKLVVQSALIDNIGSDQIQANAINANHIQANTIKAGSAIIQDGAIENAKIGNVIQSHNFSANGDVPVQGWKLDKNGVLTASGINVSGKIHGGHLLGSIIEGSIFVTNSNVTAPVVPTDADSGSGTRYFANPGYSVSKSAGSTSSSGSSGYWTALVPIASYNYTAQGSIDYGTGGKAYKNYDRYPQQYISPYVYSKANIDRPAISGNYPLDCNTLNVAIYLDKYTGSYSRMKSYTYQLNLGTMATTSGNGSSPSSTPFSTSKVYTVNLTTHAQLRFTVKFAWGTNVKATTTVGSYGTTTTTYYHYSRQYPYQVEVELLDRNSSPEISFSGSTVSGYRAYVSWTAENTSCHTYVSTTDSVANYL